VKLPGFTIVFLAFALASADAAVPPDYLSGDQGAVQLRPGATFVPYPGGGPPPWERGPMARGPSLALALKAAQAAIAHCASTINAHVAVAVIDAVGQPRATMAADGIRGWHIYNATRKALTALAFREPSSQVAATLANPAIAARLKPNMSTLPGAVPLWAGHEVVGAIGVSGARNGDLDQTCAAAGAAAIADSVSGDNKRKE